MRASSPVDYISRHPVPLDTQAGTMAEHGLDDDDEVVVNRVVQDNLTGAVSVEQVSEETDMDPILSKVKLHIAEHKDCPEGKEFFPYKKIWTELTVAEGVVVRGHRVVIPAALRLQCVENGHSTHFGGPTSTLSNLRNKIWFPTMGAMVEEYCETCGVCQAASPYNVPEPMLQRCL